MKKIYSAKMTNSGGRSGNVNSPDGSLSMNIAAPGSHSPGATNPEQLFAAGYSSCFNGALEAAMLHEKIRAKSTVSAIVSLYEGDKMDFRIGVEIEAHIEGQSRERTEDLMKAAHLICPYSKATRGNIEVILRAV